MTLDLEQTAQNMREYATILEHALTRPYGREIEPGTRQAAGHACVTLCRGDQDQARTLWKLVVSDCGGYMPEGAGRALIRAANTLNLVPDIEAPIPT